MRIYLLICLFVSCYACNKVEITKCNKVHVNTSTITKNVIIHADEYLALETNEDCVVGNIDKLIAYDNKIYILDREVAESIFIYDNYGRFISKISNKGKGLGEYLMIDDFLIDDQNGEIRILDLDQGKIICYDDNRFIREVEIDNEFCFIENFGDHIIGINDYCGTKDDCYGVLVLDKNLNVERKLAPFTKNDHRVLWELRKPVYKDQSGVYITEAFSNVIHRMDKDFNYEPYVYIDFGKEAFHLDKNDVDRKTYLKELSKTDKAFLVDYFMKNNHFTFFEFFYQQSMTYCFYSDNNPHEIMLTHSLQDANGVVYTPIYMDEDYMYCMVKASNFMKEGSGYKQKVGDIDLMNNPILAKIRVSDIRDMIKE
ncbi:6-bladed beta-propeller [Halosquirtibacter xylanolyticus]|uniref:6-bladed beta-propeller n=1 Tax=Halosquirtibacter xylanolyticus TaxID=3374599 RepID=UPI0037483643|nr:6-bladed beta-propeller [Prolixibacteraceae bacterium]